VALKSFIMGEGSPPPTIIIDNDEADEPTTPETTEYDKSSKVEDVSYQFSWVKAGLWCFFFLIVFVIFMILARKGLLGLRVFHFFKAS
jgi:hypothetical protein